MPGTSPERLNLGRSRTRLPVSRNSSLIPLPCGQLIRKSLDTDSNFPLRGPGSPPYLRTERLSPVNSLHTRGITAKCKLRYCADPFPCIKLADNEKEKKQCIQSPSYLFFR